MSGPTRAARLTSTLHICFGLVGLNFLAQNFGGLSMGMIRPLFALWLGLWFVALRAQLRLGRRELALLLITTGLVLHTDERLITLAAGVAAIGVLALSGRGGPGAAARPLALGGVLFFILRVWYWSEPALHRAATTTATYVSEALSGVLGQGVQLGPTPLGLWVALTCSTVLSARFLLIERSISGWLIGHAGLCAAIGTTLLGWHALPMSGDSRTSLTLLPLAVLLVAGPVVGYLASAPEPSRLHEHGTWVESHRSRVALVVVGLGCSVALWTAALLSPLVVRRDAPRVLFYSVNEGSVLDWERPVFGRYEKYSQGMFGLLPEFLEEDGFQVEFLRESPCTSNLSGVDTLVTINADTDWSQEELLAIWRFVQEGGSLLVLGDHTDVMGTMQSQNALLAPAGIRLRFDSALPSPRQGWSGTDRMTHAVFAGSAGEQGLGVAVGASLELSGPARSLLNARFALSDRGDRSNANGAFLGDYEYQPGELFGDVALAAWAPLGRGRIVAFGDTTGFQNGPIASTYYEFGRNLFTWLTGETLVPHTAWRGLLLVAGALAGLLAVVVSVPSSSMLAILVTTITLPFGLAEGIHRRALAREPVTAPTAWIDLSHAPRIDGGRKGKNRVGSLQVNLTRNGYQARSTRELTDGVLRPSDVLVMIAPAKPVSARTTRRLREFVHSGGLLIVAAGHEDAGPVEGLLGSFDLAIGDTPVGPVPLNRNMNGHHPRLGVEFVEAWPVCSATADGQGEAATTVYAQYHGVPLIVLRKHGAGGILVIGDTTFFSAENLEDIDSHCLPNILLLKRILTEFREDAGSPRSRSL